MLVSPEPLPHCRSLAVQYLSQPSKYVPGCLGAAEISFVIARSGPIAAYPEIFRLSRCTLRTWAVDRPVAREVCGRVFSAIGSTPLTVSGAAHAIHFFYNGGGDVPEHALGVHAAARCASSSLSACFCSSSFARAASCCSLLTGSRSGTTSALLPAAHGVSGKHRATAWHRALVNLGMRPGTMVIAASNKSTLIIAIPASGRKGGLRICEQDRKFERLRTEYRCAFHPKSNTPGIARGAIDFSVVSPAQW